MAPLVDEMLQRISAEVGRYERVIAYWPVFGPQLEGAVCAALRETTAAVTRQCGLAQVRTDGRPGAKFGGDERCPPIPHRCMPRIRQALLCLKHRQDTLCFQLLSLFISAAPGKACRLTCIHIVPEAHAAHSANLVGFATG